MAGEWLTKTLGELGEFRNGANFSKNDYGVGLSIVNVKQLYSGRFVETEGLLQVRKNAISRPESLQLQTDDLLFARSSVKASGAGQLSMIYNCPPNMIFSGFIIRYRVCEKKSTLPLYLCYVLRSARFRELFTRIANGTTISNLSQETLKEVEVPLPPLSEQKAIAHILGTLDDKIELNRRMNETLEEMARTLFKSWFVDFDPVRAKLDGRQPAGMDAETAALFPAEFQDSELGKIPKGWEVKKLESYLDVLETGRRPKGGVAKYKSGIPSVGAESINGIGNFNYAKIKYVPEEFFENMKAGKVEDFDVLLYKDGGKPGEFKPRIGMYGLGFPFSKFGINEHVFRMRSSYLGAAYLYFHTSSVRVFHHLAVRGGKAAIPGVNQKTVKSIECLVPLDSLIERFNEATIPKIKKILENSSQSQSLASLRDTLLPKLLSGELRIKDAEKFVENAL